jgi:hypothetical protein
MPKIPASLDFTVTDKTQPQLSSFSTMLAKIWRILATVINGSVSFGNGVSSDNISGVWLNTTTPGTPNTNFTLNHNLGRLPVGYLVMTKSAACDVFTGSVAATKTQITLQASVAGVNLSLFVL